jgi:prepilin-type N-terminal cleavage/methylation domain-containing protein
MNTPIRYIRNSAFTLVELSIVLVIIGVIVGAIMTADFMAEQAKIVAVASEVQGFRSAIRTFQLQYNALPGDMTNAGTIWPSCDAVPANCNGNGDGLISSGVPNNTTNDEGVRAWQHLSLAGMLAGSYTGTHTVAGQSDIGINVPASKFPPVGYFFYSFRLFDDVPCISLVLGAFTANSLNASPVITPTDAQAIDLKTDDGMPKTGNTMAEWSDDPAGAHGTGAATGTGCVTGATNQYNFTSTAGKCDMQFMIQKQNAL